MLTAGRFYEVALAHFGLVAAKLCDLRVEKNRLQVVTRKSEQSLVSSSI